MDSGSRIGGPVAFKQDCLAAGCPRKPRLPVFLHTPAVIDSYRPSADKPVHLWSDQCPGAEPKKREVHSWRSHLSRGRSCALASRLLAFELHSGLLLFRDRPLGCAFYSTFHSQFAVAGRQGSVAVEVSCSWVAGPGHS